MITNTKKWKSYENKNKDDYGKACVDIARQAMLNLDKNEEIGEPNDFIIKAEHEIGEEGMTGFMAGMVSLIITQCHSRGEEWKKAWNKSFGDENRKGVINPAIIEIG